MRPVPAASAYKIIKAPDDFRWRGQWAPGLPIVCEQDGSVCEPISMFLGWSYWNKRVSLSSLQKEAYVLREWWAYLEKIRCPWERATDRHLSDWRESMRERTADEAIGKVRISHKCHVVFTFYQKVPAAMDLPKVFVSRKGPITESETIDLSLRGLGRRRKPGKQWALNGIEGKNNVRRGTPDAGLAAKVLTYLRNSSKPDARDGLRTEDTNDRDWLIGRVMSDAGLRGSEVSRLALPAIWRALAREGIAVEAARINGTPTEEVRKSLLHSLDHLQHAKHRENIWVIVTGKGEVTREVPFPISLIRDLLVIGIWGLRDSQLARWAKGNRRAPQVEEVFLSEKTGRALTKGAIGNLIKQAFTACGSDLSGHRLRAFFATQMAARLWHEVYAQNGFRWDQTVENMVLDQVARALGHAQVDTTVKHYVALAQMTYFNVPTKSKLKQLRETAMALKELAKPELDLASRVASRLAEEPAGSPFAQALEALLDHPGLRAPQPPKAVPPPSGERLTDTGFRLRIVPENANV